MAEQAYNLKPYLSYYRANLTLHIGRNHEEAEFNLPVCFTAPEGNVANVIDEIAAGLINQDGDYTYNVANDRWVGNLASVDYSDPVKISRAEFDVLKKAGCGQTWEGDVGRLEPPQGVKTQALTLMLELLRIGSKANIDKDEIVELQQKALSLLRALVPEGHEDYEFCRRKVEQNLVGGPSSLSQSASTTLGSAVREAGE